MQRLSTGVRVWLYALAILLLPLHCLAWGQINPANTRIVGRANVNGAPLNVGEVLGSPVHYYVPATFNAVSVVVPATADEPQVVYTVDVGLMVGNALEYWSESPRTFRQLTQAPDESFQGIRYAYSSDLSDQSFGYTILDAPRSQARVSIVFPLIGLNARAMFNDYNARAIIHDLSIFDFIEMLIWQTVLHETGHALGLIHPEDRAGHDALGYDYIELVPPGSGNASPSIMMGSANGYLEQLYVRLGHSVTLDDIRPSVEDLRGATLAWRGMSSGRLTRIVHSFLSCMAPTPTCVH